VAVVPTYRERAMGTFESVRRGGAPNWGSSDQPLARAHDDGRPWISLIPHIAADLGIPYMDTREIYSSAQARHRLDFQVKPNENFGLESLAQPESRSFVRPFDG
jgi:hypothetical protein